MQPDQLLAVLNGDLIESQKYPDNLETALDIINQSLTTFLSFIEDPAQHIPIAKFRADSFQAVMGRPEMALRAAVFIRANLVSTPLDAVSLDARIAIGIGRADSLNADNVSLSGGRPFRKSGLLLDAMAGKRQDMMVTSPWEDEVDREVNTECLLADAIIRRWSAEHAGAVKFFLLGKKQEEIARELGISQAAVSYRLNEASYRAIAGMLTRYEELVAAKVEPAGKMVGKAAGEKERRSSMMQDAAEKLARRIMAKGYRGLKDTEVIALEQEEFAHLVERELADLKREKARKGFLDR